MKQIDEYFGCNVFHDTAMRQRLPKDVYRKLKDTIRHSKPLDISIANAVAKAMKEWAVEKGATHYTHWFQPMTGITAEKHESFLSIQEDSHVLMEFSGKELIKGEPDASSFPSGGLRATFEARGYTAWDPTSYAFLKDHTLYIPTAFCSYDGSSLDKKTPLLRSMETLNKEAMRIIRLFPDEGITDVMTTVGPEQEYFLIDRELYRKRPDLVLCGRTLIGAAPAKGQELDDHYFGNMPQKVIDFMKDVDEELWKLGVFAKTEHKEVAPGQFELAPIFTTSNLAADHNQLMMEILRKTAIRHGMECLLHEKPFAGFNGSGKHNNWSMTTNTGINLLDPGQTPYDNARFLLFLTAVIKAVDEYQDLLRVSVATAGNDHRLGADEAPPAVISVFLGEELYAVLEAIEHDRPYDKTFTKSMTIGSDVLPAFPKDTTDRNRTSPFAFTGNKFEFRMLGSSLSISCPNIILNTIVAEELSVFADQLEQAKDFQKELNSIIRTTIQKHKHILFNGNGYSEEWLKEAEKRGLLNIASTPEAIPHYIAPKNITLFKKHHIYNESELIARDTILYETYYKTVHIEASVLKKMILQDVLPAAFSYEKELLTIASLSSCQTLESEIAGALQTYCRQLYEKTILLEELLSSSHDPNPHTCALQYQTNILPCMKEIRAYADQLEEIIPTKKWPYPSYYQLLYHL